MSNEYEYDEMQIMEFRGKWCVQAHIEAHHGFYVKFGFEEEDEARKLMNDTKVVTGDWKFFHYLDDSNYDPDECFEESFKAIIYASEYRDTVANNATREIIKKLRNVISLSPAEAFNTVKTEILKVI